MTARSSVVPKPAFEQVIEQHGLTVLRVCRATLGVHDADDAWSETFLAALQAYPRLPDGANIGAWLVRIARNKSIDIARAASRQPIPTAELPELPSQLGNPGLENDDLWRAVAGLPEKQRLVLTFRYLGGLSHGEIAALLGGSVPAARRAAADGVAALRSTYANLNQQGATR
ncbi:RNA polymerase sigma factor [Gulosibacter faecalis]|jgi:RNA polymerase sigma factor (sigma-70 family)|uniref:RNA polymerase sigma factor n=1 Tax=Gulosibacter faecalis TaxID=272240 RepID=A0ABW5UYI3_9MICO|nr:sigma-70 family RNA polymerase sigma factor [Gulosibacter faecalis]